MYFDSMFSMIINIPISVSFPLKMTRPLITFGSHNFIWLQWRIFIEDASILYGIMVIPEEWLGEFYARNTMDDSDLSKSSLGIDRFPTYWWRSRWWPKSLTVRLDGFSDQRIVPLLKRVGTFYHLRDDCYWCYRSRFVKKQYWPHLHYHQELSTILTWLTL